jgi:SAM-dependent methyltransferase
MKPGVAVGVDRSGDAFARSLSLVVCPRCGGTLAPSAEQAACGACGARYPARDGGLDLRTGSLGEPGYDPHYYETLARIEREHFWFVARRERILWALRRFIPDLVSRPLFDVGSGSGGLLRFLKHAGLPIAVACDAYPRSLQLVREGVGVPTVLVDEGRPIPFGRGLRLVGMFDVLEHVDDDTGLLASIRSALEPGGYLALTVPAHPALFDDMDRLAHHRRRYSRTVLRRCLEGAGFEARTVAFFMAPLVPLLLASRVAGRVFLGRRHEQWRRSRLDLAIVPGLNAVLLALLRAEGRLWRWLRPPFGTSLLAIGRRPETDGR